MYRPMTKLICVTPNCNWDISRTIENNAIVGYCKKCGQLAVEAGN
jgi:hypothetical protein